MAARVECVVIGAGVVGLAIARELALAGREVLVLEAAPTIGSGTSSRNSEVIHAGIYYPPGSWKARLCVEGRDRLYRYCTERGIAHRRCGKLLVASGDECVRLDAIRAMAEANGVHDLRPIAAGELAELEPAVAADAGLLSPSTGIVDSHALMLALQGDLEAASGMLVCRAPVEGGVVTDEGVRLTVGGEETSELLATLVVNAAGLHAPQLARAIAGVPRDAVPRQYLAIGHYYALTGKSPFNRLVYPVPEPGGLGIHVTLDLAGQARFGPDVRWIDTLDYRFDGARLDAFVEAIRRYYPDLDPARLAEGYTGIRPKLSAAGEPAADFRIDDLSHRGIGGLINLFGIESPGLTAALAIGRIVADKARTR